MNNKVLLLIILSLYLGINISSANNIFLRDTLNNKSTIAQQDTTVSESEFSDLESELDEINENRDTTKIRVGNLKIAVIEDGEDVIINRADKDDNWDDWGDWDTDDRDYGFSKINKNFKPHWASFAMGINNYMTSDFSTTLPDSISYLDVNTNKSYEVVLNIAQLGIPIIKDRIGLVTGVGFKWNNYKFSNPQVRLIPANDSVNHLHHVIETDENYTKSKLTVSYLMIPAILEFQVPVNDKPLYLSGGVEGGLKLGSHTKMKTTSGKKTKDKSDFHVSSFTLAVVGRVGYGSFGLYGTYNLQTLFEDGKGPELYPFAIGVSLNF